MEAILSLNADLVKLQRDELAKCFAADRAQKRADAPHIRSSLHTMYTQLAFWANIHVPDDSSIHWSKEELIKWMRDVCLPPLTKNIIENYQTAKARD